MDILARERLDTMDLLDLVVAVYAIAFNAPYNSGKVIESFSAQEKKKRSSNRVAFSETLSTISGTRRPVICFFYHRHLRQTSGEDGQEEGRE